MVQVDGSATETSPLLATSLDGRGRTPASSRPPLVLPSDGVATMSSKAGDRRGASCPSCATPSRTATSSAPATDTRIPAGRNASSI
ncbi:hypothetical protein VTK73DRAFT_6326 [Phialemonium thermophilum]|uniref:Uncharacterized protein n=1 Tax=Phialemonium thermophilum TaxID=223376 RepID=A0ABR3UZT6_9PEZI